MVINAFIDRFENGNAVILSDEIGIEVSIPEDVVHSTCNKGDTVTLTFNEYFEVENIEFEGHNE